MNKSNHKKQKISIEPTINNLLPLEILVSIFDYLLTLDSKTIVAALSVCKLWKRGKKNKF